MNIEDKLNDLVCPIGKYPLELNDESKLVCTNCRAEYPVIDGIPHLLIDDAVLPEGIEEYSKLKCFTETQKNK